MNKLIITVVVLAIIGLVGFQISAYTNVETFKVKVEGKERVTEKSGDNINSFYLVYTDKGTFKLEDDLFRGNFHSSDVYGKLRQDSTYTFTIAGYRIGFMSSYPNIINVK
jgi:hypothetical protein|tara:strand:- start:1470 stop:1799 length:330 start_codon:yes stop_codon:yes gene_type:complete